MARIASTVLVVALLAATASAFVLTQGLKLEKSPIFGTRVDDVFSPVCGCDKRTAAISFKLRSPDRVDVSIVRGDEVVRSIERGRRYPAGTVVVRWDGRDDAGRVLPEGEYQPRVHLDGERFTTTLPNPVRLDVTAPALEVVSIEPRVFSPDGDKRADRVDVRYRLSEPGRGTLWIAGERRGLTRFPRTEDVLTWYGIVDGEALEAGVYPARVGAFDQAGNRAEPTEPVLLVLRYLRLGRDRVTVAAGATFAIRVSSDAASVRWRLGGRTGEAAPGTLRLRAPRQKGRFTLTVSANGRTAQAAIFVREPR